MIELFQAYWQPLLYTDGVKLTGLAMTLWLLVASLLIGALLALPLAVARTAGGRWMRTAVRSFTYVFCGTPLYIQLLICYSGLYGLDVIKSSEVLRVFFKNGLNCAILAFALNSAAYTTEILAGAMRTLPPGEIEAARAYGLPAWKVQCFVIVPAALRRALPYYSNEVILLLHATSIAFAATVPELMKVTRDINGQTYMTFQVFAVAALLYAVVSLVIVWMFRRAEIKWLRFLHPVVDNK
ncbi:histidine ABC transporter permease HisM [Pseudomonas sp. SWRI50]|uniref:histidine ABC transporter permease HisM n=1 Tax=Pseudomonas sp. SWRI50 TaxID=2745484 RepID=UPI001648712A|nr:histidine ABC transporter permease HisM [Pseudomonas sp. SWRI50]MBC3486456.1 histidine ABC transporter permease HisM [Pseudomonas sp. SWRI50]